MPFIIDDILLATPFLVTAWHALTKARENRGSLAGGTSPTSPASDVAFAPSPLSPIPSDWARWNGAHPDIAPDTILNVRGLNKLTPAGRQALRAAAHELGISVDALGLVIASESGFNTAAMNPLPAAGLIQLTPQANLPGFNTADAVRGVATMSAEDQFTQVVIPYYKRFGAKTQGANPGLLYMFNFLGARAGYPESTVLGVNDGATGPGGEKSTDLLTPEIPKATLTLGSIYKQNHGFDAQKKGYFTVGDVYHRLETIAAETKGQRIDVAGMVYDKDGNPIVKMAAGCGGSWAPFKTAMGNGIDPMCVGGFKYAAGPGFGDPRFVSDRGSVDGRMAGQDIIGHRFEIKTAGGCGLWDFPDTCGAWGPMEDAYPPLDPPTILSVKVVKGPGRGVRRAGFRGHHFAHPWYGRVAPWGGVAGSTDFGVFCDPPYYFGVSVMPDGSLVNAGGWTGTMTAEMEPGAVYALDGRQLGVARTSDQGYELVPPGYENATEVSEEFDVESVKTAAGPYGLDYDVDDRVIYMGTGGDCVTGTCDSTPGIVEHIIRNVHFPNGLETVVQHDSGAHIRWPSELLKLADKRAAGVGAGSGWGETIDPETRRVAGPGVAPTPDQIAIVKRGVVEAVRSGDIDPVNWTSDLQVIAPDGTVYTLSVTNEPIASHGLRLPTSFDDAVLVAKHMNALPITPAISDARWVHAKQDFAKPLNDKTGALMNDPDQVVRHNALAGPNTGEFRDGAWKELVVVPGLQKDGKGSMAQYGFKDAVNADGTAKHMFEHGGPSNHNKTYKDYSDTPTYVGRTILKNGQQVDLLDEYAAGSVLGGPLPKWLIDRLKTGDV